DGATGLPDVPPVLSDVSALAMVATIPGSVRIAAISQPRRAVGVPDTVVFPYVICVFRRIPGTEFCNKFVTRPAALGNPARLMKTSQASFAAVMPIGVTQRQGKYAPLKFDGISPQPMSHVLRSGNLSAFTIVLTQP